MSENAYRAVSAACVVALTLTVVYVMVSSERRARRMPVFIPRGKRSRKNGR